MGAFKRFIDTFVLPKDEPKAGELHYVAPEGRLEVHAIITTKREEQDVKRVLDIMLNSRSASIDDCGLTD